MKTAADAGITVCFANPGTTEMPLVTALDSQPAMRGVLVLQENVATGAADGYGRMAGTPALTLLHLGPGFANGISNLHNARRARSGIVNLIGEHATWHAEADAPLASDIEGLAAPVSAWIGRAQSADDLPALMSRAVAEAGRGSGKIATLILPHDLQGEPCAGAARLGERPGRSAVAESAVAAAAEALKAEGAFLFLGNAGLSEAGLKAAARVAAATGAVLMSQSSLARAERGGDLPHFRKLPYLPELALEALAGCRTLVLAGAPSPVSFFGWPGYPSSMVPEDAEVITLAEADDDVAGALDALAAALGAPEYAAPAPAPRPALPSGPLTAETLCQTVAALQPENAIVVDEMITTGWSYHDFSAGAPRFTQMQITGGAIGLGPALSLGAAVACPDRPVIGLQADGSGLYTVQALWSQAREATNVTTVICSNRRYKILEMEMQRAGVNRPGEQAAAMTSLDKPPIDWVSLARGFGVPAVAAETAEDLAEAFRDALAEPGPRLIEAVLA